jgi:hypothetical protein
MQKRVAVAAFLTTGVLLAGALDAGESMRMQVSPSVARAPADLVVRVSVEAAADNRFLQVIAESPDFYRSSQIPMDGEHTPPLSVFEFRNLPSGLYSVTGVLIGVNGRRAVVSKIARVEPPFGR